MADHVANIRTVVHVVREKIEIVSIEWPENSESLTHNHGKSYGWTLVQEGEVYEIIGNEQRIHKAGEWFTETPDTVHRVGSVKGAKTLHCYNPPITGTMTTYTDGLK